jgi:hypothetical protein
MIREIFALLFHPSFPKLFPLIRTESPNRVERNCVQFAGPIYRENEFPATRPKARLHRIRVGFVPTIPTKSAMHAKHTTQNSPRLPSRSPRRVREKPFHRSLPLQFQPPRLHSSNATKSVLERKISMQNSGHTAQLVQREPLTQWPDSGQQRPWLAKLRPTSAKQLPLMATAWPTAATIPKEIRYDSGTPSGTHPVHKRYKKSQMTGFPRLARTDRNHPNRAPPLPSNKMR